jgi:D-sedoheptulose 7-phosphate isomerase
MSGLKHITRPELISDIEASIETKRAILERHVPVLSKIIDLIVNSLKSNHKLILFGNGGSAADCQHIAAELVNKFSFERRALPAIALTTDTSILTAIGNDYSFDNVFSRQIEAIGHKGDVALAISTSGNSPNVLNGVDTAKKLGLMTIAFTGQNGGRLKNQVDICFYTPSQSTPRIQEAHITIAHIICHVVEKELCVQ